ncbi:Spi family protease inhibitor [Algoriphagus confluentis]|uniref:Spi family protease inhibitor n=1 Tax=Algoriphagus confluentis TaxID=1697556 RepID=UPI0030C7199B
MAKKVAMGFFSEDSSFIAARKGKPSPKIREIARVSLADSLDFEAYVVNVMEGFVMIAGDSRVMPILAYSTEGELTPEDLETVNGLKVWYQETMKQIDLELKEVRDVHPIVYNEWKKYTEEFDPTGRIWNNEVAYNPNTNCYEWYQYGQFMCSPYFSTNKRLPLYSYHPVENSSGIKWGQSGISNYYAPSNSSCSPCNRSPIGCGAVAIAQTLWYFRPGSYAYSSMPANSNGSCSPSGLGEFSLATLMFNSATNANTIFNFGGCNGMTLPGYISPALEHMGMIDGGNTSNFNPSLLNNELYQGYPAIFYGHDALDEWHIWTCDGFKRHNYRSYDCDLDGCMEWSYTWYFMNWGWNDNDLNLYNSDTTTSNGYYSLGVYTPSQSSNTYNNGLKIITGIR